MSATRRFFKIVLAGTLSGAMLAIVVPPKAASALDDEGCKCDDDGVGQYQCNSPQTACVAGTQTCNLKCAT